MVDNHTRTALFGHQTERPAHVEVQEFGLILPDGKPWRSPKSESTIGSHASNDLVIDDPTVSRFHCELVSHENGLLVRDTNSRNGTVLDGVRIESAFARGASVIQLGNTYLRVHIGERRMAIALSDQDRFGVMVGQSVAMRRVFAMLERSSASDATLLLEGETGTGKEAAAESIHANSPRRNGPFVVVDCAAIPANLLESELFGHQKGAFTGASQTRIGAFEAANDGTIFLDELGELPSDLQPKLLRVLEQRTIRKLGTNQRVPINVRVIAATNRNLREEVNQGNFRSDLYYRLAVIKVVLPPLRERPADLPLLVNAILKPLGATQQQLEHFASPAFLEHLAHGAWPGNVRELRNYIERCLVMDEELPIQPMQHAPDRGTIVDPNVSYQEARRRAIAAFERDYLGALVDANGGNVSAAARSAGMDRVYLHRLLRKHGVR